MTSKDNYPALMEYIENRNQLPTNWCDQLRLDQSSARKGDLADVALELAAAKLAFGKYPYNRDMGLFLGLTIRDNDEPQHGYYMACQVQDAYETGVARRAVEAAIASGKPLKLVAARDKATRKPIRFHTFAGNEISIVGNTVECANAKRRVRLSSNWSEARCLEAVQHAIETGAAYGEAAL